MRLRNALLTSSLAVLALGACSATMRLGSGGSSDSGAWHSLLDGNLDAWRGYKSATVPKGWSLGADGVLTKSTPVDDIMTKAQYTDFELEWEWKLGTGGNSGVLYRGSEEYDHIYWTAPEYQLLDDANAPDGKNRLTSAASGYGLYPFPAGIVHAAGEWNSSRIVVRGNHVEHWLNGVAIEYELGSPDWTAKVAKSKFNAWADYGKLKKGYISIQGDHNGTLSVRNIKIRELK